jgi:hypothetical protein
VQKPAPKKSIFDTYKLNDVLSDSGLPQQVDISAGDQEQRDDTPMQSPVTDASSQPSLAAPGARGAILRKENSNCLVYFSNKLKHMDYQKAKDEGHDDNVKKDMAKLHCKDDEIDLIALKKEDVGAFSSKIKSVFTSQ